MSEYAGELIMREKKGILIVVSGFSGAGKVTLMKKLEESIFSEPKKNLKK